MSRLCITITASRIDITLSDGRRTLVEGPAALAAVVSLVQGLVVDPGPQQHARLACSGYD